MRHPIHFCIATLAALVLILILLFPTLTRSSAKTSTARVKEPARVAQTVNVSVGAGGGNVFSPTTLNIQVGDTVHWAWSSGFHSVTSGTCNPGCTPNGKFDSGQHGTPFSFDVTFNQAGTYPYYCSVHGGMMSGTITVVGGQRFTASLSPAQEVPTPTGSPMGSGIGNVTLNAAENQIVVSLSYTGMSSTVIAAHIHGDANSVPGQTAPIIFDLMPSGGTSGTNTATTFAITPAQVALLRTGHLYFNVHTQTNQSGECRGQIHLNEAARNFDADGRSDLAVMRPSDGYWYVLRSSNNSLQAVPWGIASDVLVNADYDGDGKTDFAVFRNGTWYVLPNAGGNFIATNWGFGTDIPVPGDYDKDGKTDIAVFRPSNGTWYVLRSSDGGFIGAQWGQNGDKPVPGDYDRDGRTDLAVFRPVAAAGQGTWYILNSSDGSFVAQPWGRDTDKPVPGDYDGDGKTDIAVYRESDFSFWYILNSSNNTFQAVQWGTLGDITAQGDFDSDAKTDVAVWRPSNGTWYAQVQFSGSSGFVSSPNATDAFEAAQWGQSGDKAVHYVPEQ
jgi:plastocyanin